MGKLKLIASLALLTLFCFTGTGCATLKESKGDTLEDTRKLFYSAQDFLKNFSERTFIIK